ncbi:MAG: hypothetical protein JST54_26185 [Deltaproteobacteria bacterium]|nr:hypothetical protein [Deltaproteobacteria bacterium]
MYRQFRFEGDIHEKLDCVPLTVRRKLDLAQLKISLEGWQALTRPERLALCHLSVDTDAELSIYREVLQGFCARAGVHLKPLQDADAEQRSWNAPEIPALVTSRLAELGVRLDASGWRALDEETRYALLKLAHPKRTSEKLHALCVELGIKDGPAPKLEPQAIICAPGQGGA